MKAAIKWKNIPESLKSSPSHTYTNTHRKIVANKLFLFYQYLPKTHFVWQIFFSSTNIRYLVLLICVIWKVDNGEMINLDCIIVCFAFNRLLDMLFCRFGNFYFYDITMSFKNLMKKLTFKTNFKTFLGFLPCDKILKHFEDFYRVTKF